MTTTINKVTVETDYKELKDIAKTFGINFVGKGREVLVSLINDAIDAASTTEVESTTSEETTSNLTENGITDEGNKDEVVIPEFNKQPGDESGIPKIGDTENSNNENEDNEEDTNDKKDEDEDKGSDDDKEPTNEDTNTPETTTTSGKAPKWHEGGYGNKPGDKVIIKGKHVHQNTDNPKVILQGRTAKVVGPSNKKNMIQAVLLDPKNGSEQNCTITLAFGEYADYGTIEVEIPQRKTRKKVEQVVEETPQVQPENKDDVENPEEEPALTEGDTETNPPETLTEPTNEDDNKDTQDDDKSEVEAS